VPVGLRKRGAVGRWLLLALISLPFVITPQAAGGPARVTPLQANVGRVVWTVDYHWDAECDDPSRCIDFPFEAKAIRIPSRFRRVTVTFAAMISYVTSPSDYASVEVRYASGATYGLMPPGPVVVAPTRTAAGATTSLMWALSAIPGRTYLFQAWVVPHDGSGDGKVIVTGTTATLDLEVSATT
jgi:hypothetical protein